MIFYVFPFALQGVLMVVDEFYCHQRRELRRWERVGHPLDTLTFVLCMARLHFTSPVDTSLAVYALMALFSCLFITKDEWEHRDLTTGFENWLHSLLFILHPIVLIWAGAMWQMRVNWPIQISLIASTLFMFYQAVYWNFWKKNDQ